MSNFRFRLTTLLRLREAARDESRSRLAEARGAEEKLLARRDELSAEIDASEQAQRALLGAVDVDRLMARHRYEIVLKAERNVIDAQHATLTAEIDRRREVLIAADREVRILEKLREKLAHRHAQAEAAAAAKQLDEMAGRHWRGGDA